MRETASRTMALSLTWWPQERKRREMDYDPALAQHAVSNCCGEFFFFKGSSSCRASSSHLCRCAVELVESVILPEAGRCQRLTALGVKQYLRYYSKGEKGRGQCS